MTENKRRAQRVPIELWVMVEGLDDFMVKRRGDISASGLLFEADEKLSEVGSLEYLHLAPADRSTSLTVMAQLVRVVSVASAGLERVAHAFELFPQSESVREQLDALIQKAGGDPVVSASVTESLPDAATFRLTLRELSFVASWPVAPGAKVQIAVNSPDGSMRVPFEGMATEVKAEGEGHRVTVDVAEPGVRSAPLVSTLTQANSITGSIDLLFNEWMASQDLPSSQGKEHLRGRLDRVPLSGLLMLFDMERMSGELRIDLGGEKFTLYLLNGTLLDVEPAADDVEVRRALQRMATAVRGSFEFRACDVSREPRLGMSTTVLLLELARERDETGWSS